MTDRRWARRVSRRASSDADIQPGGRGGPGHHGCGHRRGVRPQRPAGGGRRSRPGRGGARPWAHRALHRTGGGPRQAGRVRAGRAAGPDHLRHRAQGDGRGRPGHRGGARAACPQAGHLHRAGRDLRPRDDPGHQHLLAVGHRDRGGHQPARQGRRRALLQPRAGDEAGRGGAQRGHRAGRGRRHRGVRGLARQDRRHHRRPGRLHRQRAAVRLPQPRRRDVLRALRQPRGHRRRDEAGLRPADGPAGAAGPDRPGHRLRDPRHHVQAVAGAAARPDADLQAPDHRRPARPQGGPRLLHLRRAGLAEGGGRRQHPGRTGRHSRRPPGAAGRRGRLGH